MAQVAHQFLVLLRQQRVGGVRCTGHALVSLSEGDGCGGVPDGIRFAGGFLGEQPLDLVIGRHAERTQDGELLPQQSSGVLLGDRPGRQWFRHVPIPPEVAEPVERALTGDHDETPRRSTQQRFDRPDPVAVLQQQRHGGEPFDGLFQHGRRVVHRVDLGNPQVPQELLGAHAAREPVQVDGAHHRVDLRQFLLEGVAESARVLP
uniref:hypothetical protein n=1 Tax=Nocardiopsis composta TaxID=157465 RepID=UPI001C865AD7|nr:hypothetical protein [Nocardiopsis composta]